MFFYVFYFLMFLCLFHCTAFAFCLEDVNTQNYKYDAIHFGKLR